MAVKNIKRNQVRWVKQRTPTAASPTFKSQRILTTKVVSLFAILAELFNGSVRKHRYVLYLQVGCVFESNKNQSALFLTPKTALKRPQRDQLKTMMHNLSHTLTLMWDIHEEKDEKAKKETRTGLGWGWLRKTRRTSSVVSLNGTPLKWYLDRMQSRRKQKNMRIPNNKLYPHDGCLYLHMTQGFSSLLMHDRISMYVKNTT